METLLRLIPSVIREEMDKKEKEGLIITREIVEEILKDIELVISPKKI
jgi:hypothetical protein